MTVCVLRGIGDGAPDLAAGDWGRFMTAVALRVSPPRSGTGTKSGKPAAKPAEAPAPEEPAKSPMQKLMDRFK
jgi:PTH1 family peptidyl-tRNA hydrolase